MQRPFDNDDDIDNYFNDPPEERDNKLTVLKLLMEQYNTFNHYGDVGMFCRGLLRFLFTEEYMASHIYGSDTNTRYDKNCFK